MINDALKIYPPHSPSESFVLQVYEKYRNREENIFGEYGIQKSEKVEINL